MPREGTKAAEIMRLYSHGIFSDEEIADHVGCGLTYVRVVTRQRMGAGTSIYDQRYMLRTVDRRRQYAREHMRKKRAAAKSEAPNA